MTPRKDEDSFNVRCGVDYNWNDGGTTGKISYQENDTDGVLEVTTTVYLESWASLEDEN